jgi:hypothetical protein
MLTRAWFTVVDWSCVFGPPEEGFGPVVMPFPLALLFVVEYVAADAPLAEIANATKATTDAHNIVERFIIILSLASTPI